jgi:tetratricopeptide (TPR) repeat protein
MKNSELLKTGEILKIADVYFSDALSRLKEKKLDEAVQFFKKAIALKPEYVNDYEKLKPEITKGYFNVGVYYQQQGMCNEAINAYKGALEFNQNGMQLMPI